MNAPSVWICRKILRPLSAAFALSVVLPVTRLLGTEAGPLEGVVRLVSPDRRIQISLEMPAPGSKERPRWSARFRDRLLLSHCGLGLETASAGDLLVGARLARATRRSVNHRIPVHFGKSSGATDRYEELTFTLETPEGRRADVVVRCYDDAIALRYVLPAMEGGPNAATITGEATSFQFEGDPTAFVQYLENERTSHEHNVVRTAYRSIQRNTLLDLPLTFLWEDNTYAAITEAALRHYAGMSLRLNEDSPNGELVSWLTSRPDGTKVVRPLPLSTPWRVVLIGERPGRLLESQTIYCLNEPSVIEDISWIHPDKITFPWWNGDVYDGKPSLPILSLEMAKQYIDFCARNGLTIHSLTSTEKTVTPWYHQSKPGVEPGPDTDVTRPREGFDLPAIRRYAESKGVRLWTWVHQGALRGRVEEAFAAFEKMGWTGMMVDFFDHDDQASVEFAEEILAAAARHHILIHFHGVWKPTGVERTYPNLMNHEGALNLEYLKWSDRCTPEHNLMMVFTRLIAGPMDYHLGGFRSAPREQFQARNVAPYVLGTRGHMLGMYVCFNNPTPMVADYPTAYEGQPGFDFLKIVPTWWDETRVLRDDVGELLVVARRKHTAWYLGGMSALQARALELPLSFLGEGAFKARIWKDGSDAERNPNQLLTETGNYTASDTLRLRIALDGGFVARFLPQGRRDDNR